MLESYFNNPGLMIITTGALVGIAASLVGTFLVLRRSSMLSDAISHSILLGIVLVFLMTGRIDSPLHIVGAALAGVLTVVLSELLSKSGRVKNDAAIGLVFPALFAIAIILINLFARNVHIDTDAVLLGEITFIWLDTVEVFGYHIPRALITMTLISVVNLGFISLLYKELKLSIFDAALARALGFYPTLLFYILLSLTSITAVGAFDAVGAILLVAFVIVPPSAAYLLTDRLWRMLVYSCLIALLSSITGYYLAVRLDVSISGMMASMTGFFLLLSFLLSPRYGLIAQELRRIRQQQDNAIRLLLVHLYQHEASSDRWQENTTEALQSHLRWSARKADVILKQSIQQGYTEQVGSNIKLRHQGRKLAQGLLEPWRH